jgi:hypothetical protein
MTESSGCLLSVVCGSLNLSRFDVTIAKRGDDMSPTALGQLAAKDLERPCGLVEELGGRLDNEPSGVSIPGLDDSRVNVGCGTGRLCPERILVVVAVLLRGRAQVDDSVVSTELYLESRAQGRPELFRRPWPVRQPVDRSPITQHNGRIVAVSCDLQLSLHMEDRSLRGSAALVIVFARKAASEDYSGGFGEHLHMGAEGLADQFE